MPSFTWDRHWAQVAARLRESKPQVPLFTPTDVEAGQSSHYGRMILGGFQVTSNSSASINAGRFKAMYQGQATETEGGCKRVATRRARNKVGLRSRRINRHG